MVWLTGRSLAPKVFFMQANYVQRLRFQFSKDGPARYISHLDLARTLERAFNRARLPVAYTRGFNRRPRMQFATALPLGYTSSCELADVLLAEALEPAAAQTQMMSRMAPGLEILSVWEVPAKAPSLQASTLNSTYLATPLDPVDRANLQAGIDAILGATEILRERRGKSYDLRPLVEALWLDTEAATGLRIGMRLALQPSLTGRPDEVLAELGLDPLDVRVHRTELVMAEIEVQ